MPNLSIYRQTADGQNTGEYYNILSSSNMSNNQKNLKNPVALGKLAKDNRKTYRVLPTVRLQYDFFDPEKIYLRYNGYVSLDMNTEHRERFLPSECTNSSWDANAVNQATDKNTETLKVMTENKLTWQSRFSNQDHNLQAMAAWNTESSTGTTQSVISYGHPGQ